MPVEIPGRIGYKLKNSGNNTLLCRSCRQNNFRKNRDADLKLKIQSSVDLTKQRLIPAGVAMIALLLVIGGLWLRQLQDVESAVQDTVPLRESPSSPSR
ncbi:MAG: hypothetical protein CL862_10255 [Cyanobium sp. NAT70]|jgi:hypothetical protein|nr:hypothetical protein [Cyanobium sp. NAT70]